MQREACYLGSFALRFVQLPLQVVAATYVDGDIVFDFICHVQFAARVAAFLDPASQLT